MRFQIIKVRTDVTLQQYEGGSREPQKASGEREK